MVFTDGTTGLSNGASHHHEPDDISLILRQLLRRSSSSSSSTPMMHPSSFPPVAPHAGDHYLPCFSSLPGSQPAVFSGSDRLVVDRISDETPLGSGVVLSSPSGYFPASGETNNLSSESLTGSVQTTTLELDHDYPEEGDCESEEGPDPVVGEAENNNQQPSRSQSKRSRAAEVHNLSEKRRRSRINEKMKALQNLIPNSNKTDKASMLDEAIEYLKQLQLQVQMLSMRNGLSLHPMCLPGVPSAMHPGQLSQMGIDLGHQGATGDTNLSDTLNMTTSDTNFILPKQCAPSARPSLPGVSTIINSEAASFGLESCIQSNFGSFGIRDSPQIVDRDQSRFRDHFAMNNNETKSLVTTAPCLFETRESDMRDHNPLEGHTEGRYGSEEILVENIPVKNQLTASNLSGYN